MKKSFLLLTGLLVVAEAAATQAPAPATGPALASPRGLVMPNQLVEQRTTEGRRQGTAQDLQTSQAKFNERPSIAFLLLE